MIGCRGSMYSNFCLAFGSRVLVNDPYKDVFNKKIKKIDVKELISESDIIAFHVHVNWRNKKYG